MTSALACFGSTALADPPTAPNIPAGSPETASLNGDPVSPASELPLPYQPWQGGRFAAVPAPTKADLPPPLARLPELPRRPYELTLALAALLPNCGDGSIDARGCSTITTGGGVDAALFYRARPFFAVGIEGVWSAVRSHGGGPISSTGGSARYVGVAGRVYFADAGSWDPYASLSMGYGSLELRGTGGGGRSAGFGARVAGGIDYLFGSHLRLGPTLGFAQLIAFSEQQCDQFGCSQRALAHGRLLGFATLGLRVTGSWGDGF